MMTLKSVNFPRTVDSPPAIGMEKPMLEWAAWSRIRLGREERSTRTSSASSGRMNSFLRI